MFFSRISIFFETLNGRLPLKHGSDRRGTWRKCVSDDSQLLNISFFDVEKKNETSNGRLPPEDGSDRPQTLGKRVSGDPRHLIFRRPKLFFDKNVRLKNFANTPKDVSAKCLFWRSYEGLDVTGSCASKIHCQTYRFQPSTTLGGGVKETKTVFDVTFGEKKLKPSSLRNSTL